MLLTASAVMLNVAIPKCSANGNPLAPDWDQQRREIVVDPLDESAYLKHPQSFNRYRYVENDPINSTDPEGLMAWTASSRISVIVSNGLRSSGYAEHDLDCRFQRQLRSVSTCLK